MTTAPTRTLPSVALTDAPLGVYERVKALLGLELTPRALLDINDGYMADASQPVALKQAVWDVFTAMRGPDRHRDRKAMRHRVTAHIRAAAFPRTAKALGKRGKGSWNPKMAAAADLRRAARELQEHGGHFASHCWRALLALARWA